jgi:hypothetical protein
VPAKKAMCSPPTATGPKGRNAAPLSPADSVQSEEGHADEESRAARFQRKLTEEKVREQKREIEQLRKERERRQTPPKPEAQARAPGAEASATSPPASALPSIVPRKPATDARAGGLYDDSPGPGSDSDTDGASPAMLPPPDSAASRPAASPLPRIGANLVESEGEEEDLLKDFDDVDVLSSTRR